MSDVLNRAEFENLMDEYLRDELNQDKRLAYDKYLELHPEALQELEGMRQILALTTEAAPVGPPEDLAEQAAAGLRTQLSTTKGYHYGWFKRPVFAWSFAATLMLVVGLTLWPAESSFVYARLIESLKKVECVKVEGWVRGENGDTITYRQWVAADGTLRAELGENEYQRIVILKGSERLIRDNDGKLYQDNATVRWPEDLAKVFDRLQVMYQSPDVPQSSFEYSKEDLGNVVRFKRRDYASLGHGPSNHKWVMEVDKKTALPTLLQFFQQIEGRWVQMSDLRFSEFNNHPAEGHFRLDGTPLPVSEKERQRFWYELSISPGSIQWPAVHVPDGGIDVYWPTAEEMPAGMSGGCSTQDVGGVIGLEYWAHPLGNLVYSLTGQKVLANDIAQKHVSLLITSKTAMPWKKKLEPVLDHLGLAYEMVPQVNTKRRYIFGQDGRNVQPSLHRFENSSVNADSSGYKYHYEKTSLQKVAMSLLGNCNRQGFYTENDTIEFVWNGAPQENPFEFDVDLDCELSSPTFESNVEFLKKDFGLTLKIEEKKTEALFIRLIEE